MILQKQSSLLLLSFFLILIALGYLLVSIMFHQGAVYRYSKHSPCFTKASYSGFCDIQNIQLALPRHIHTSVMKLAVDKHIGKRIEIPMWKAGRTINTQELMQRVPQLIQYYKHLTSTITSIINEPTYITPLHLPTSCSVLIYEKQGDFINWHYDVNYYKGRFFTLLIPLSRNNTCTSFIYKKANMATEKIDINPGSAILFEGEHVFHMASKLCKDQTRVMISMQFVTNDSIRPMSRCLMWLKDIAYIGILR